MRTLIGLALLAPGFAVAQSEPQPLPTSAFVTVDIDGSLNLRLEPSTEAGRITRLADGTILRRVACGLFDTTGEDASGWCEVETLDGATAGWASAAYLSPYAGADPAALTNLAIAPDRREETGPGPLSGALPAAGIVDHVIAVPEGTVLKIVAELLPETAVASLLDAEGTILGRPDQSSGPVEIEFTSAGTAVLRLLDTGGTDGLYAFTLGFD